MKKILLSLSLILLMAAGAQSQVNYGIKAGLNLPKLKLSGNNTTVTSDVSTNFYVSGYVNNHITSNFVIQPGLSLQGKGAKFKNGGVFDTGMDEDLTINLMSVEIPVNALYYIPAGTASVFIGAGPYLGINISGSGKVENVSEDIEFGSESGKFNRIDYGANFQAGIKLAGGFLINAGYGLGIANVWNTIPEVKTRNNVLSFGLGFEF